MASQAGCPFCRANNLLRDTPLFESDSFFVLAMREEARRHAVMIVLGRHAETPFDILPHEWSDLPIALDFTKLHLAAFAPAGYSIGWNVGQPAGQHVSHVHLHVICRFDDQPATGLGINGLITRVNE